LQAPALKWMIHGEFFSPHAIALSNKPIVVFLKKRILEAECLRKP